MSPAVTEPYSVSVSPTRLGISSFRPDILSAIACAASRSLACWASILTRWCSKSLMFAGVAASAIPCGSR